MTASVNTETALAKRIAVAFARTAPAEAAKALDALPPAETAAFLHDLPDAASADVVARMNQDAAAAALSAGDDDEARSALTALDPVRAAGLLARVDDAERSRLLALVPEPVARDLRQVLQYPAGTAGWFMDPRVTLFPEDATADAAIAGVRLARGRRITDLVVADADLGFVGVVSLQDALGADPECTLADLVQRHAVSIQPMALVDEVRDALDRHKLASLPVVGLDGKVLGVIRHDALVRAAEQDLGGALLQMVGADAGERALSSVWTSVKSRLPWLQINLATAFLASAVVGLFDATIAQFTALAVLLPVVAGQSGNTGAQALAVVSRGLALREIRLSHAPRVLRKEATAALINGLAVSAVTSLGVLLWSQSLGLTAVIGVSMIISMLAAALAGGAIPILLTAVGRDPATASSIILTTVTDVCGFFSFLGLATLLSGWLTTG